MNEDKLTLGQAEDKIRACLDGYMLTNTYFLDPHQQSLARSAFANKNNGCAVMFYGGYDDAERVIMMCLPDYMLDPDAPEIRGAEDDPLTVIRAESKPGGRELGHRDYLGSLMGLGIKREMTGDILVREGGADIIVMKEIAEFILSEYDKAGRTELSLTEHSVNDLIVPERELTEVRETVASMRLDNITAAAFGISRSKAAEAINQGLVFVDHIEASKTDMQIAEGSCVTMRHKGRVIVAETDGSTRKGRIRIMFRKY